MRRSLGLLPFLVLVAQCGSESSKSLPESEIFEVSAHTVQLKDFPEESLLQGSFFPNQSLDLKSEGPAKISEVLVQSGQSVAEGEVLLRSQNENLPLLLERQQAGLRELEAQLGYEQEQAQMRAEASDAEEENAEAPTADGSPEERGPNPNSPQRQFRSVRSAAPPLLTPAREDWLGAQIERSRVEIAVTERQLQAQEYRAPFAGVVEKIYLSVGAQVSPGSDLIRLVQIDPLEWRVTVGVRDLAEWKIGERRDLELVELPATRVSAELISVGSSVGPEGAELRWRVANPGLQLKAGMKAALRPTQSVSRPQLALPSRLIKAREGRSGVYVIESGQARFRAVERGEVRGDWTLIDSGVKVGERVVDRGLENLNGVSKVRVKLLGGS